jgi:hypothetical protein
MSAPDFGEENRPAPDVSGEELLARCWSVLVEKDDRTSPEEYPEMCLITREELGDFLRKAAPAEQERLPTHGDLLAEINKAAHASGTNAWVRDVLKRAHRAIRLSAPPAPSDAPCDAVTAMAAQWIAEAKRHMDASEGGDCESGTEEWLLHREVARVYKRCAGQLTALPPGGPQTLSTRLAVGLLFGVHSALDDALGDSDVTHIEDDDELRDSQPVQWAAQRLMQAIELLDPSPTALKQNGGEA